MSFHAVVLAVLFAALPIAASSQTAPGPTLKEALMQSRTTMTLSGNRLNGPGADVLNMAIQQSRFVLLGEDHLTHEIPPLAAALCGLMHPDAYAVEAGPYAAQFVNGLLHSPDRIQHMAARGKTYPSNMAFLDMREENDLAAHCAASSRNPRFALWGLDQEYLGSAGTLLQAMAATHPGPQARTAIAQAQLQEHADAS